MFQFGRLPSYTYVFSIWYTSSSCMDCSIRKSTYHSVLTAPRGLSQLITSFFGSQCQGILHMLFFAWTTKVLQYFLYILWYTSVLIAWIAVFHTCSEYLSIFWQNCFFTLNRKTWFRFHDIFVFPFTFVCHVCHTNSFELICYKFLFGFQWTFRLTLSN